MAMQHLIDGYCSYFAAQLKTIQSVPDTMQRKLLTVAVLDTFARARVPQIKGNGKRFVEMVRALCDWKDAERISLVQLALTLAGSSTRSSALARETEQKLLAWEVGRVVRITEDPEMGELIKFANTDTEKRLLVDHQHINLLYVYRNSLVHEFREPGYDMGNLNDDPTPYYMNMDVEYGRHQWELAYPGNFFGYLAERALVNLRDYLERNGVNPYEAYDFGSRWRGPR